MRGRTKFSGWLIAGTFLAACGPTVEEQAQLAELPVVTAEKERLQGEVQRLTAEISAIEAELANLSMVPAPASGETTGPSTPETVGHLVAQVGEMEAQLTAAETRLRSINATSTTQRERITELEANIATERNALQDQMARVSSLEAAIRGLEAETTRQSEINYQLTQTVEEMTDDANKVWYLVGTKEELLDMGVIREEGGSRVLFIFGKRGKTIVPSRDIDPTLFTAVDQRDVRVIPLDDPEQEPDATWTVVTPQNLAAVGSPLDDRGRVVGDALNIVDPEQFWANSRYLIVVRS
jgi:cell division protein FtsB